MHDHDTPIFARADTLLGVCHGLGQELGVDPTWFRVALALGLFFDWQAVVVGYLAVGVALAAFRWVAPFRAAKPLPAAPAASPRGENDDHLPALAEAA